MEERKRRAKNRRFFLVVGAAKQPGCLKLAKRKRHGRKPVVVYMVFIKKEERKVLSSS